MQPPEMTLVVAATRNMGIGAHGTMPWTGLRREMQYFARVTSRVPAGAPQQAVNAVIMGRKTWDSIPPKFRPLKNRLNIILSRSAPQPSSPLPLAPSLDKPVHAPSLASALDLLAQAQDAIARVFVIGGAQIYSAALEHAATRRVLLTALERDFDCDTFFPLRLCSSTTTTVEAAAAPGWRRCETARLREWTGEVLEGARDEENGTAYEFQMWEKVEG